LTHIIFNSSHSTLHNIRIWQARGEGGQRHFKYSIFNFYAKTYLSIMKYFGRIIAIIQRILKEKCNFQVSNLLCVVHYPILLHSYPTFKKKDFYYSYQFVVDIFQKESFSRTAPRNFLSISFLLSE